MKCSLCGFEFDPGEAQSACKGCGLLRRCGLIRCPRCLFELIPEPNWMKKVKTGRLSDSGKKRSD